MPNASGMSLPYGVGIRDPVAFRGALDELVEKYTTGPVHPFGITIPVVKVDKPKGLVTAWASVVTTAEGVPIVDHDGEIIPIAELEKAAQDAFADGAVGRGKAGDMHERTGAADLVESFVVSAEKREALGFGKGPEGWVVTLKIKDSRLLAEIVDGTKTELSIRGSAERIPV